MTTYIKAKLKKTDEQSLTNLGWLIIKRLQEIITEQRNDLMKSWKRMNI